MGKLILIVDDDPLVLKLITSICEKEGYMTVIATNGKQAIELAKVRKPSLVLMDLQLPIMDGFQSMKTIKADVSTKHIPILALSALAMEEDKAKAFKAGCDGYITKPIDIQGFLKKIKEYA